MSDKQVVLGHVNGFFGVKGWLKVYSYTRPVENILEYEYWNIGRRDDRRLFRVLEARVQGKTLVVQLGDAKGTPLPDRDAALPLLDLEISVDRAGMPELPEDEFYWCDLLGLAVVNRRGEPFGKVKALMETGANDVLVVSGDRERLIPFVMGEIIDAVDLEAGRIVADWEADF